MVDVVKDGDEGDSTESGGVDHGADAAYALLVDVVVRGHEHQATLLRKRHHGLDLAYRCADRFLHHHMLARAESHLHVDAVGLTRCEDVDCFHQRVGTQRLRARVPRAIPLCRATRRGKCMAAGAHVFLLVVPEPNELGALGRAHRVRVQRRYVTAADEADAHRIRLARRARPRHVRDRR